MPSFRDRSDAGRQLAEELKHYASAEDVLVIALPAGGIPIALEVAAALVAPVDVQPVVRMALADHPDIVIGAVAPGGIRVLDHVLVDVLRLRPPAVEAAAAEALRQLRLHEQRYQIERNEARDRTLIVVDDGLASGATMRAAAQYLRMLQPERIVAAVPVAAAKAARIVAEEVDELVCVFIPEPFHSLNVWYDDFRDISDDELTELLARVAARS